MRFYKFNFKSSKIRVLCWKERKASISKNELFPLFIVVIAFQPLKESGPSDFLIHLDCVHTMLAHFENGENVTVAKFELAFTQYRNNLKTVGNLMVKNSLHDFDTKEMYLHSKNRPVSFQKH